MASFLAVLENVPSSSILFLNLFSYLFVFLLVLVDPGKKWNKYIAYHIFWTTKSRMKLKTNLPQTFNSSFCYTDDVLSLNNSWFCDYLHHIYLNELEVKNTTDTQKSTSYLDLHIDIDNRGRLKIKLYDKRDDFTFPIANFPFISWNIPASPAHGVYISQYSDFLDKTQLLTQRLLKQGYVTPKSSLQIFYGRHHNLIDRYELSMSQMTMDHLLFM